MTSVAGSITDRIQILAQFGKAGRDLGQSLFRSRTNFKGLSKDKGGEKARGRCFELFGEMVG